MSKIKSIEENLILKAKSEYKRLHSGIIGEISSMLKTAKIEPMHYLTGLDPSFTSLVVDLESYMVIIEKLKDSLDIKARDIETVKEYIVLARDIAESIDSGCSDTLGAAIAALDEKPYV